MRKVNYLSILALLFAMNANAQDIKFGVRGGVNISTIVKNESNTLKARPGVNIGGFVDFGISEHFSIQPGLQITTKGASDGDYKFRSTYLEVPVYAMYHYNTDKVNFFGGAGPYFALGVGGQQIYRDYNGNTVKESIAWEKAGAWRRSDVGLALILGVQFAPGIQTGINFDLGIANIHKPYNDNLRAHNRTFGLFVGYVFNAKK
jgi:hypothetical protein